ncbi:MAG: hypothetical protein R3F56_10075 [Planctomycetota bacterium]
MLRSSSWLLARFCLPLLAHAVVAQEEQIENAGAPAQRFTLAAGSHSLRELVEIVGLARKQPIDCGDDVWSAGDDSPLTLQRELRLGAEDWEDVATALLYARGLSLTHDADGKLSVLPNRGVAGVSTGKATMRAADEVLRRPYRTELARVRYVSKGDANALAQAMRPLFALRDGANVVLRAEDGAVVIEGLTCHTVFVLRAVLVADGADLARTPGPTWSTDRACAWPGGSLDVSALLERMATELDANVLCRAGTLPGERIDTGEAKELAPQEWLATAARLLRRHGLVVTVIHGPQRVFEVLALEDRRTESCLLWRAAVVSPDTAADPALPVQPVVTMLPMSVAEIRAASGKLRAQMRRDSTVTVGSCPRGLFLAGLSDDVGTIVTSLRPEESGRR